MKEFTEIICILDRSGSMGSIKSDAIGGFNTFLEAQKAETGKAFFTLIQFDTEYETVYENMALQDVPLLTEKTFVPRGATALLDAIGATINSVGKRLATLAEENRPTKVIMAILTDGEENSSREYKLNNIKEMIKHQEDKYAWEVLFLAANQDAFAEGFKLGIKMANTVQFDATGDGVKNAYDTMHKLTSVYRTK